MDSPPTDQTIDALKRLEESERRYRNLFEQSADAIVLLRDDQYLDCNQAALSMFGFESKPAFLAGRVGDSSPPTQPDGENSSSAAKKHFQSCLTTGSTQCDWTCRRTNGEEFVSEVSLTLVEIGDSRVIQAIIRDVSKHRLQEEALRAHDQYLQSLLDSSPIAIAVTAMDTGVMKMANRRALDSLEIDELGNDSIDISQLWIDPADREFFLQQVRQHGQVTKEVQVKTVSGRIIDTVLTCQLNPGTTDELLWWSVNISSQKAVQAQLQQHEHLLEEVLDYIPMAIWVKDVQDDFRYVVNNMRARELYPWWEQEVVGRTDFDFAPPNLAEERREQDLRIVRTGEPLVIADEHFESPSGEQLIIRETKILIPDAEGKPMLILGMAEDLTERKEAERALRVSEKRFRELAANAPVGIFLTDSHGACIFVNAQWQKMTGLNAEQAAGDGWMSALHVDDVDAVSMAWRNLIEGVGLFDMDYRFVCLNGYVTWVSGTAIAFRNEDDQVVGFLGSTTDITNSKKIALKLQLSRDEADRANASKSEFLSRMSHELRTPLNAVLGFGQLLQMTNDNLTTSQNEGVEHILAGGTHLLHLIEDVLDFSRIDSGHVSFNVQRVETAGVLHLSAALVATLAEQGQIEIIQPDTPIPDVIADARRLKQVLVNLLSNAVKYNTSGGTVELTAFTLPGDMVRISIKDSGFGIPQKNWERLFEPFERVANPQLSIPGAGIGLSICKKLVELMGGTLGFESIVDAGSTFWVDLPAAVAQEGDVSLPPGESTPIQMAALENIRILYVEDHLASIRLMTEIARQIPGCEIIAASSVPDGVALAKSSRPDLILMDINLPGLSGFDALEILQSDERTRGIPVVALSAGALPEMIQRGNAAGFAYFLTKPLKLDILFRTINAVMKA